MVTISYTYLPFNELKYLLGQINQLQMTTDILLIANAVFFSFYVAGHLFDLLANVPNWKSGEMADVENYRNFYSKSTPKNFFAPFVLLTPLLSLVCLIFVWSNGGLIPVYIGLSFVLALTVLILTLGFFVPINKYVLGSADLEPNHLKKQVKKWVSMDYLRFTLLFLAMFTALFGMYEQLTLN